MANEQQGMPGLELASAGPEDAGAIDEGPNNSRAEAKEAVASRGAASDVGSAVSVSAGTASSSCGESKQPCAVHGDCAASDAAGRCRGDASVRSGTSRVATRHGTHRMALGNWSFTFPAIVCGGLGMRPAGVGVCPA